MTSVDKRIAAEVLAVLSGDSPVLKRLDERHKVAMVNRYVFFYSGLNVWEGEGGRKKEERKGREVASSKLTFSLSSLLQVQPAENAGSSDDQGCDGSEEVDVGVICHVFCALVSVGRVSRRRESRDVSFPAS